MRDATFDIRSVAGRLRLVAVGEALSWAGLLVGIVPLVSVTFIIWADRTGKLGPRAGWTGTARPAGHVGANP